MNTIREQNYCESKCIKHRECSYYIHGLQFKCQTLNDYFEGYDKAMQDIFDYIEAHIPCGELSSGDVRGFINECKNYMQNESEN